MNDQLLIERGPLLNFWRAPILLPHPHLAGDMTYPGNEWRFQAEKTTCVEGVEDAELARLHEQIAWAPKAREAKKLGRELEIDVAKWDAKAYGVMLKANRAKFSQNPELSRSLLETGHKMLIEHRPDPVWGDNMDGSGKNSQGWILMRVRAELLIERTNDIARMRLMKVVEDVGGSMPTGIDLASWAMLAEQALWADPDNVPARKFIEIVNA